MRCLILLSLLAALAMPLVPGAAAGEEQGHESVRMQAVDGEGYATDQILRQNMLQIRDAVEVLSAAGDGRPDTVQIVELSAGIAVNVREIIKHCRLPPEADAELHRIIHPLMLGAQALQTEPGDVSPLASMREALGTYEQRFEDPGFKAPAE